MKNRHASAARRLLLACSITALWTAAPVLAATPEVSLTIENHRFTPSEVRVPAGQRIKLSVHNRDGTPEEFESHSLNREKVIPGGARSVLYIGPLKPGRYEFFGEFHEDTAKGVVIAE